MKRYAALTLFMVIQSMWLAISQNVLHAVSPQKQTAIECIDTNRNDLEALSDDLWRYAEIAMREFKSSKRATDLLEQHGFRVERGVADMPTAFVASYGSGEPVIGLLAEYDALPGLSQKNISRQEPLEKGSPGHGCGHNLFGAASIGAAIAVKTAMETHGVRGTIRLYGCPAEETVVGKVFMVRAGLFNDCAAVFSWHPGDSTRASIGMSLAMNSFKVNFCGKTAHGAGSPWEGRSALDAVELMDHAANMMREHVKPTVRIHYVISNGGLAPNVVPGEAEVWYFVRDLERESVENLYKWLQKIAEGAALATQTTYKINFITGVHEMMPNQAGAEILQKNLELVGPPQFTPEEEAFTKEIQRELGKEPSGIHKGVAPLEFPESNQPMGSTDVADVSWQVPLAEFTVATKPAESPGHHWAVAACGGTSIGKKGMIVAAKTLAISAIDLFSDPALIEKMREEWSWRMRGREYKSPLPPDLQPPVVPHP